MRALMSNMIPNTQLRSIACGVKHYTERDMVDFEVSSEITDVVERIFDTTYEVLIDMESAFGRRAVHRYGQPNQFKAPEKVSPNEYAQLLGKTAIAQLYVIGFTTINESLAASSNANAQCAAARLEAFTQNDFGSTLILFEKPPITDVHMQERMQSMYLKVSELGLPSVCVAPYLEQMQQTTPIDHQPALSAGIAVV